MQHQQQQQFGGAKHFSKKPFIKPFQAHDPKPLSKGLASGGAKLLIKNLHWDVPEARLKEIFAAYGPVHSAEIVWDKQDRSTGEARVTFERPKDAAEAVAGLDGSEIEGQQVSLVMLSK
ncbi:hypothetical protein FGO68_gene11272 [Halteria grandinella]|uniref:RRM domain-containing protein n=1 Tax=Halteria grandinella TaxID=5974 RepID=A0A8J8NEK5_HALGN|nr:hypothetical protein FGO68_gene11272 [Halteria grandinella]